MNQTGSATFTSGHHTSHVYASQFSFISTAASITTKNVFCCSSTAVECLKKASWSDSLSKCYFTAHLAFEINKYYICVHDSARGPCYCLFKGFYSRMCMLLPCCAVCSWKVNQLTKSLSSSSNTPQVQTESAFVTEAKLALKLTSFKPSSSAPTPQGPPTRAPSVKKVSKKEAESKERLQAIIDQYAPKK